MGGNHQKLRENDVENAVGTLYDLLSAHTLDLIWLSSVNNIAKLIPIRQQEREDWGNTESWIKYVKPIYDDINNWKLIYAKFHR